MYIKTILDHRMILLKNTVDTGYDVRNDFNKLPTITFLKSGKGEYLMRVTIFERILFLNPVSTLFRKSIEKMIECVRESRTAVELCSVFQVSNELFKDNEDNYEFVEYTVPDGMEKYLRDLCEGCITELEKMQAEIKREATEQRYKYKVMNVAEGDATGYVLLTKRDAALVAYVTNQENWSALDDDGYSGTFKIDVENPISVDEEGISKLLKF